MPSIWSFCTTGRFHPHHDAVQAVVALHGLDCSRRRVKPWAVFAKAQTRLVRTTPRKSVAWAFCFADVDADHDGGRGNLLNPSHDNACWMSFGL